MASPGLEVDQTRMRELQTNSDKQVHEIFSPGDPASAPQALPGAEKEAIFVPKDYSEKQYSELSHIKISTQSRRKRRIILWLLLGLILIIAIVIAIAVPVTTRHKNKNNSTPAPVSASNGTAPSGALNGTRFATFNVEPNEFSVTHLFYQDYAGQIRRVKKEGAGNRFVWSGGPDLPLIPTLEAKDATPLACVNSTDPRTNTTHAHLFYINQTNHLQEVISTDDLSTWSPGPLGKSGFLASPDSIAMAALINDRWGGTEVNKSAGMRLYYGSANNQVQELAFPLGADSWTLQSTFDDTNGNAGITGATGEGYSQLYVLDSKDQLRRWRAQLSKKAKQEFPTYGNWTIDPALPAVDPAANSDLSFAVYHVSYQDKQNAIRAVPVATEAPWGPQMPIGGQGNVSYAQPGSAIQGAAVYLGENQTSPVSLDVWYQVPGGNVMECLDKDNVFSWEVLPID